MLPIMGDGTDDDDDNDGIVCMLVHCMCITHIGSPSFIRSTAWSLLFARAQPSNTINYSITRRMQHTHAPPPHNSQLSLLACLSLCRTMLCRQRNAHGCVCVCVCVVPTAHTNTKIAVRQPTYKTSSCNLDATQCEGMNRLKFQRFVVQLTRLCTHTPDE